MASAGEWRSATAPNGRTYYYNTVTKVSQYEVPPGFPSPAAAAPAPAPAPAPVASGSAAGDWRTAVAPNGKRYYYNLVTKASQYEVPPELASDGQWKSAVHNGRTYYYNTVTKETTYQMPPGFVAAAAPAPAPAPAPAGAGAGAGGGGGGHGDSGSFEGLPWSEAEFHSYMEFFNDVDLNNDGVITPHELLKIAQSESMGMTHEDALSLIASKDENNDGVISVREFITFAGRPFPEDEEFFYRWLWDKFVKGDVADIPTLMTVLSSLDGPDFTSDALERTIGQSVVDFAGFRRFVVSYI